MKNNLLPNMMLLLSLASLFISEQFVHGQFIMDDFDNDSGVFDNFIPEMKLDNLIDEQLMRKFEQLAMKEISNEAVKFGEAIVTVMTQRVENYMLMRFGKVDQT